REGKGREIEPTGGALPVPCLRLQGLDRLGLDWPSRRQISTWVPSSTTRLVGIWKNSVALAALRERATNNFSRQTAIAGATLGISVSRDRKKLVSIRLKSSPWRSHSLSSAGTSGCSLNP